MRGNSTTRTACALCAWLVCAVGTGEAGANEVRALPAIPIVAWHSIPESETSAARFAELAAAGFTVGYSSYSGPLALEKALGAAAAAGIKLMFRTPQLLNEPEQTIKMYMHHPGNGGYVIKDEPSASQFVALGRLVKRVRALDDQRPAYLNLLPIYATTAQLGAPDYRTYVEQFVENVPIAVLSFDHYPIVRSASGRLVVRATYYENIEIIAEVARRRALPFWAFCLSVPHGTYPPPAEGHLRLQIYTALAYGAKGIQYFTYWTPTDTGSDFGPALIDGQGHRTPTYDIARRLNEEIAALSPILSALHVQHVWHTAPVPRGTVAFSPGNLITRVEGGPALISLLTDAGGEVRYLMIASREFDTSVRVTMELAEGVRIREIYKDARQRRFQVDDVATKASHRVNIDLAPGDAVLYLVQ